MWFAHTVQALLDADVAAVSVIHRFLSADAHERQAERRLREAEGAVTQAARTLAEASHTVATVELAVVGGDRAHHDVLPALAALNRALGAAVVSLVAPYFGATSQLDQLLTVARDGGDLRDPASLPLVEELGQLRRELLAAVRTVAGPTNHAAMVADLVAALDSYRATAAHLAERGLGVHELPEVHALAAAMGRVAAQLESLTAFVDG